MEYRIKISQSGSLCMTTHVDDDLPFLMDLFCLKDFRPTGAAASVFMIQIQFLFSYIDSHVCVCICIHDICIISGCFPFDLDFSLYFYYCCFNSLLQK